MIKNLKKFFLKFGLVFAILYPVLAGYIYFSTKSSDEYRVAVAYVQQSVEIKSQLGEVNDVSLAPFGINISHTGDSGKAQFSLYVSGSQAKGKIQVNLRKTNNIWQVESIAIL